MIKVPDHERVDGLKLEEKRDQQTQAMHFAQGLRGVRLHQDAAQVLSQLGQVGSGARQVRSLRLHKSFRLPA